MLSFCWPKNSYLNQRLPLNSAAWAWHPDFYPFSQHVQTPTPNWTAGIYIAPFKDPLKGEPWPSLKHFAYKVNLDWTYLISTWPLDKWSCVEDHSSDKYKDKQLTEADTDRRDNVDLSTAVQNATNLHICLARTGHDKERPSLPLPPSLLPPTPYSCGGMLAKLEIPHCSEQVKGCAYSIPCSIRSWLHCDQEIKKFTGGSCSIFARTLRKDEHTLLLLIFSRNPHLCRDRSTT